MEYSDLWWGFGFGARAIQFLKLNFQCSLEVFLNKKCGYSQNFDDEKGI